VDDDKPLNVGFLNVDDAGYQHPGVADYHSPRLGDDLEAKIANRLEQDVGIFGWGRRFLLIRNAEAAAQVQVLSATPASRSAFTIVFTLPAASLNGEVSVICEPIWVLSPTSSRFASPRASA